MDTATLTEIARANPEAAERGREQLQAVLQRAATDFDFRGKLLTDPRNTLTEFSGQDMPEGLNIVFIENHADATIVLPTPVDPAAELSDAELEAVAGGSEPVSAVVMSVCVFLGSAALSAIVASAVAKVVAE